MTAKQETVLEPMSIDNVHVFRRVMIVSESQFKTSSLLTYAHEFVRRNKSKRLAYLAIFVDSETANRLTVFWPPEYSYEVWRGLYERLEQGAHVRMADVIYMQNSAVLRIRNGSAPVQRFVIGPRDPTQITISGERFSIVHISMMSHSRSSRPEIDLFVRSSSEPDMKRSEALTNKLGLLLGNELSVKVKSDAWFISEHYPLANPFESSTPPPTYHEYVGSRVVDCVFRANRAHCR